jgi:hemerythrin
MEFLFTQVVLFHTDIENKPLHTLAANRGTAMNELVWKSEYSIGHFKTDNEHKELISLANKVIHFSNTGEDIQTIRGALKALLQYTIIHFRNEEQYMERLGYPEIERHKACHAQLVARLDEVITENSAVNDLVHGLKRLMVVWVIEHIINEDLKIKAAG